MSRTSLFRPRLSRAVCHRPATGTRLLPIPYPRLDHSLGWGIPLALRRVEGSQERNGRGHLPSPPHLNTHYKRCPKAPHLRLRSDQSPSRSLHGRSPDKSRHALSKSHCQVRAPLTRRKGIAPSGDAPEHGVMLLPWAIVPPWAIAPCSDSHGLDLAGQSEQSDERRLKTNAPFSDSPAAAFGEADLLSDGRESTLPFLRMVEHFWWRRLPHRDTIARLLHVPSEVRGCRRAVADVKPPLRRIPPIGTMAGHFWWSRPPHSEIPSLLLHVLSEVRGCRRVVADVKRPMVRTPLIGTGVDAFSRNRPGPSITPTGEPVRPRWIVSYLPSSTELEAEVGAEVPTSASVLISPSPLKALRVEDVEDAPGRAPLA